MMNALKSQLPEHPDDELLNEYLDGRLTARESGELETHLAGCPSCAARLDRLQTVFSSLEALPELELSRDLSREVLAALRPQPQIARSLKWGTLAQLVTAGVILLVFWPQIGAWWQRFTPAQDAFVTTFFQLFRDGFAQIALGLTSLRLDGAQWLAGWRFPAPVDVPETLIWPVLFSAIALFLFGNALLLRQVSRNGTH